MSEASAASGLVSVPTSSTRLYSSPALAAAVARGEGAALLDHLGGFALDDGRRLSQLRMAVGSAARLHAAAFPGHRPMRAWMVTLTYRGTNADWRADHLKECWHRFRAWCNRQGLRARYVWVAELQQRGTIHYHAVIWLPVGVRCPAFDSRGWWPHGMTNRKAVRHSAVGYLMKYLSKGTEVGAGSFPKGARLYGVAGLDHAGRRARRWLRLPAFVQGNSSIFDEWRRLPGGGWASPAGVRFVSEFEPAIVGGRRCLLRVATHPRAIEAAGPFCWVGDQARSVLRPSPLQ